jgi:hypothetical protein
MSGGIHLSVSNSDLLITGCIFNSNYAPFGGGAYIGDYHNGILVRRSTFENNAGSYGGGVYITQFNLRILFDAVTVRGNAASAVGGGLYVLSADLSIVHCSFLGNVAPSSGALYSQAKTVYIDSTLIADNRGSSVDGSIGGVRLNSALSIVINSAQFINNTAAGSGGSIGLSNCAAVSIWNCSFERNVASELIGGAILALYSNMNVSNSTFFNNIAHVSGGAVYITKAESVLVTGCVFDGNSASTGSGSAVWISSSSSVSIVSNSLHNNRALQGGGTVYWVAAGMTEPLGVLENNTFSENNTALYGSAVATDATALALDPGNVYNVTDYSAVAPPINAYVVDYYAQVVRVESTATLAAILPTTVICYNSSGYITGRFTEKLDQGSANFTSLEAYCDPGFSLPVSLTLNRGNEVLQISFNLYFRECVTGEYYSDSVCIPCEDGSFSVTDPSTTSSLSALTRDKVCRECPDGSSACHGSNVILKDGYWRINDQATSTLSCPYAGSCGGGVGTGDDLCTDGYEGKIPISIDITSLSSSFAH